MNHTRLHRVAARQSGLFTRAQARACGFTPKQIQGRIARGEWIPVIGRVLTTLGTPLTVAVRDRAAQLAVSNGVLAGPSAARLWRMSVPDGRPCVAVPATAHLALAGVRFLRATIDPADVVRGPGSLRLTTRARTVFDCLRMLPEESARSLLDRALQQRWTTLDDIALRVIGHVGRHGVGQARRLLRNAREGTRSEAERVLAGLLRRAGVDGWVANAPILDGVVGDVVFARERVVVEVDGWAHHSQRGDFQRDRTRQNRLVLAGWTVLRFTWRDLVGAPERVVRTIQAALDAAGRPRP